MHHSYEVLVNANICYVYAWPLLPGCPREPFESPSFPFRLNRPYQQTIEYLRLLTKNSALTRILDNVTESFAHNGLTVSHVHFSDQLTVRPALSLHPILLSVYQI
jgi:hypothetical protein